MKDSNQNVIQHEPKTDQDFTDLVAEFGENDVKPAEKLDVNAQAMQDFADRVRRAVGGKNGTRRGGKIEGWVNPVVTLDCERDENGVPVNPDDMFTEVSSITCVEEYRDNVPPVERNVNINKGLKEHRRRIESGELDMKIVDRERELDQFYHRVNNKVTPAIRSLHINGIIPEDEMHARFKFRDKHFKPFEPTYKAPPKPIVVEDEKPKPPLPPNIARYFREKEMAQEAINKGRLESSLASINKNIDCSKGNALKQFMDSFNPANKEN